MSNLKSCGQRIKSRVGSNLLEPRVRILDRKPGPAQGLHTVDVSRAKKPELQLQLVHKRHNTWCCRGRGLGRAHESGSFWPVLQAASLHKSSFARKIINEFASEVHALCETDRLNGY